MLLLLQQQQQQLMIALKSMNCMNVLPRGNTLPPEKKPWLKSRLQTLLQSFEVVPEPVDSAVYPECDASSMAIQNPR